MAKQRQKQYVQEDVLTAALERINTAYDRFDRLAVSFSGGKDSTVILNLVLQVATERGRLPLDVFFFDEEVISPDTEDYVRRVAQRDDINMRWLCLELQGRNACCQNSPWWYYWDKTKKDLWVRDWPEEGEDPDWFVKDMAYTHDLNHLIYPGKGSLGIFLGVRAQESLRRYQGVLAKATDAWVTRRDHDYLLKPIYDWNTEDVWIAPKRFGWDVNKSYEKMEMLGLTRFDQRIAAPFAQQPLVNLQMWALLWPELWDKMAARVPGVNTAMRYSKTLAYGFGRGFAKPEEGWQQYIADKLKSYPPDHRRRLKKLVEDAVKTHASLTRDPLPEDSPHEVSGISWKRIAKIVQKGNYRGREQVRLIRHTGKKEKS